MKRILLTNDDGWDAPGLEQLRAIASDFGEVYVVAPDRHLSGCSHQTITAEPLRLEQWSERGYHLSGTPADCVRIARHVLGEFDWVWSGINDGGNMGVDVFMSGTVAAAREAALHGVPALAISQYRQRGREIHWDRTGQWARQAIDALCGDLDELGHGEFWNVNLPDPDTDRQPSIVRCPLEPRPLHIDYELEPRDGENAVPGYRFIGRYQQRGNRAGSDVHVCFAGDTAVSRVKLGASFGD